VDYGKRNQRNPQLLKVLKKQYNIPTEHGTQLEVVKYWPASQLVTETSQEDAPADDD
jgi:7-cyano-7-deazaguanine synthase in queuosine biosynthesis